MEPQPWSTDVPREVRHMTEIRRVAGKVLADKSALVEVDKRRQDMRQASRALDSQLPSDQVTLMTGSVMIKLPKERVQTILKKDLMELDTESNRLRSELKEEVSLLQELEMKDPLRGFDLQALTRPEMAAVGQVLGRSSLQ